MRYRVFYTTPDGLDGRCDVFRHRPIAGDDDVDALERELMSRFGHSNALVIGWQRLDTVLADDGRGGRGLTARPAAAPPA